MIFVRRSNITTLLTLIFILIAIAHSSTDGENDEKIKNIPVETISETLPEALLNELDDIKEDEEKERKVEEKVEKDEKENVDSSLKKLEEKVEKDLETLEEEEGKELEEEVEQGKEKMKIESITETSEKSDEAEEKSESPESASPNPKEESEPAVEFEKAPENAYAVWNSEGKICLLARLNATFLIVYPSKGGEEKTKVAITHGVAKGKCESPLHSPLLQISWDKFIFTMMFNKSDEENWIVTSVELSYDTSGVLFDGATNAGKKTARSKAVGLFETPIDKSYFCTASEVVSLFAGNKQVVTARLKDIHLQPYGVEDGKFSQFHRCNKVIIDGLDETPYVPDETVPLAVGCTLALITLCILIGFAVHRAYNAAKVDYNNMDP